MKAYQKGDAISFEKLYDRYEERLQRFLGLRLSGSQTNFIDDLFQITWMKVHRSRKDFDPKKKFSTWLFQIAINSFRDHIALHRFKEEILDENIEIHTSNTADITWQIDFEKARLQLEQLPSLEKEIILLSDLEGFTSVEIAPLLNLNEDVVRKMISRIRKKLKEKIEGLSA